MWPVDAAFGEQHYLITPDIFLPDQVAEKLFAAVISINICMIKSINAKLQAEIDNIFHVLLLKIIAAPPVKSIYGGRYFGT
jgi:hypothetical protein